MKYIIGISLLLLTCSFTTEWQPDFATAIKLAKERKQPILINFSGSDWCGPCMRMRKEIFDSKAFEEMAGSSLLMVNADFPRNKRNQLSKDEVKQNEMLADKYNAAGKFPFTVLIDADGKVIRTWDGLPEKDAAAFAAEVKKYCDALK